jgi:hypothetical protein
MWRDGVAAMACVAALAAMGETKAITFCAAQRMLFLIPCLATNDTNPSQIACMLMSLLFPAL